MSTATHEGVRDGLSLLVNTKDTGRLAQNIASLRAAKSLYETMRAKSSRAVSEMTDKISELDRAITDGELKLKELRGEMPAPAVAAPFRGQYIEVLKGGEPPVEWQIVLVATGESVAEARKLSAANQTAEKLEGDEAERAAEEMRAAAGDGGRARAFFRRWFPVN